MDLVQHNENWTAIFLPKSTITFTAFNNYTFDPFGCTGTILCLKPELVHYEDYLSLRCRWLFFLLR